MRAEWTTWEVIRKVSGRDKWGAKQDGRCQEGPVRGQGDQRFNVVLTSPVSALLPALQSSLRVTEEVNKGSRAN